MKLQRIPRMAVIGSAVLMACATIGYRASIDKPLSARLKFSHKRHLDEAECSECHEGVAASKASTRGQFVGRGDHGGCANCHEVEEKDNCEMCHVGSDKKVELTRVDRHLNFSHAAHEKRAKEGCKTCHPKAWTATQPGVAIVQDMEDCASACHAKDLADQRCAMCHRDMHRFEVQAIGHLAHDGNFIKRHGALAKDAARCAQCHDQTHCADCHARTAAMPLSIRFPERIDSGFIHRGDFVSRHAVAARATPDTCRQCHGSTHCSSCHELAGISLTPGQAAAPAGEGGANPHGPQWMQPGSAGFHGRSARRDINACASCHDRGSASNCVKCHRVGELGGNPHPRNFSWRDKGEACRKNRMCAACHTNGAGCPL